MKPNCRIGAIRIRRFSAKEETAQNMAATAQPFTCGADRVQCFLQLIERTKDYATYRIIWPGINYA